MTPTPARWDADARCYVAFADDVRFTSDDGESWTDDDGTDAMPDENLLLILIGGPADGRQIRLYA